MTNPSSCISSESSENHHKEYNLLEEVHPTTDDLEPIAAEATETENFGIY